MIDLQQFISEQQLAVEELEKQAQDAYWTASISGNKEDEDRAAELSAQVNTAYADPERYALLRSTPDPVEPDLMRQKILLLDAFAGSIMPPDVIADIARREMEIEGLFATFRGELRGERVTDNVLKKVLFKSQDVELRREAWEAGKMVGAVVADKVLELVAIRNREAVRLGFPNYYVMQVRLQELDETELFALLDNIAGQLTPAFLTYKDALDQRLAAQFGISTADLRPWHYSDPFFQEAPSEEGVDVDQYFAGKDLEEIAKRFFSQLSLDVQGILAKSDLYEKPGKMQHAYCIAIGRGTHDVRVLCNCVPNAKWMGTLLHELGHGVYDDLIDDDLPFFLRTVSHTMTTEAIAEMMGRFVDNATWLKRYAGVSDTDAAAVEKAAHRSHRGHLLVFTQWVLVMAYFERELYANPNQDLSKLWWTLVTRFQGITPPENRNAPDWAAKIHLASSPVYYHNYLLGEMTASQILRTLRTTVVSSEDELIASPEVGQWLTTNVFRPGALYSWNDLLKRATGEPLNPAHLVAELV